jgi:glycosyltransferase involved in cell wall biosynthesis
MTEVSVIIPAFNAGRYLPDAINSVLAQSVRDVEILVVDDGSTDDTAAVMARFGPPVRYITQTNSGVATARNRGLAESRGRYVAFLDADDAWEPNKLKRQLAGLSRRLECRLCFSAFTVSDAELRPLSVRRLNRQTLTLDELLTTGNLVGTPSTVMGDRRLFHDVGGFDDALSQCADWDMWVRLAARTNFLYLDEPLVTYRQHAGNMSRNARLLEADSLRVLEKGFAMPDLSESVQARRRHAFGRNYTVLAGTYYQARRYRDFLRCAARAVVLDAGQISHLVGYPARALARVRRGRKPVGDLA